MTKKRACFCLHFLTNEHFLLTQPRSTILEYILHGDWEASWQLGKDDGICTLRRLFVHTGRLVATLELLGKTQSY